MHAMDGRQPTFLANFTDQRLEGDLCEKANPERNCHHTISSRVTNIYKRHHKAIIPPAIVLRIVWHTCRLLHRNIDKILQAVCCNTALNRVKKHNEQ